MNDIDTNDQNPEEINLEQNSIVRETTDEPNIQNETTNESDNIEIKKAINNETNIGSPDINDRDVASEQDENPTQSNIKLRDYASMYKDINCDII